MTIYTRYAPPNCPPLKFEQGSTKTVQDFKTEADINVLVNRYSETGQFYDPCAVNRERTPLFGDFTSAPDDYIVANNLVLDAQERFAALPSNIRDRFDNNPLALLQFVSNSANRDEAIALGLIPKPPVELAKQSEPPKAAQ